MKILHVSDAYPPKQGGIEVQVHDLANRQLEAGHQVTVVTCAPAGHADRIARRPARTAGGPDDDRVRVIRLRTPWGRLRRTEARMRALVRDSDADVVHVHLSLLSPLSMLALRASSHDRVPVVATLHSLWWFWKPLFLLADRIFDWSRWPVQWTAVSELAAAPLRTVLPPGTDVIILPNGIDPAAWSVDPLPRDPDDVVLVTVMRLALRKRPGPLLRAFRQALDCVPQGIRLRLVVIGDGPLRSRLQRGITRYGLTGQVELRGTQQREQIRQLYHRADVYVAPAVLESFGIAALEARCAGLPVVAREQTGIADFITDREHGLLARDDAALAASIVELATTPQLRTRMSAISRATAPDWGWDEVLQRCGLAYKLAHENTRLS